MCFFLRSRDLFARCYICYILELLDVGAKPVLSLQCIQKTVEYIAFPKPPIMRSNACDIFVEPRRGDTVQGAVHQTERGKRIGRLIWRTWLVNGIDDLLEQFIWQMVHTLWL